MIILSKLHPISYWIAEKMIRLPYVGLVNLLLGEKGFEEYHQPQKQYDEILRQIELDCQQLELKKRLFIALTRRVSSVNFSRIILELLENLRHLS
jgi:lipid A disaccharide synthetase